MYAPLIAIRCHRRTGARLARAASLIAALLTASASVVRAEPAPENVESITVQPAPRKADEADDGLVPITKVVPRAKIVLKEKERLPDLDGEKTFARYGKRTVEFVSLYREPIVPMYPFAYNPIYFEDMNLERCGLSCGCCVQPVVSGLHFFGTVAILPYKMLVSPPCSCVFPPGECPPCFRYSHCENFIGPTPDFSNVLGRGRYLQSRDCQ